MTDAIEVNDIYQEARTIAHNNKKITTRILNTAQEAEQIGTNTLIKLDEDNQILDAVDDNLDLIHEDITQGKNKLSRIGSCFGMPHLFRSKRKKSNKVLKTVRLHTVDDNRRREPHKPKHPVKTNNFSDDPELNRTEDKINKDLNQIEDRVHNMKNVAIEMSHSLDEQYDKLNSIYNKTNHEGSRMKLVTHKTEKLC